MSETPITDAAEHGEITPMLAELWLADREAIQEALWALRDGNWPLVQTILERAARNFITADDNTIPRQGE